MYSSWFVVGNTVVLRPLSKHERPAVPDCVEKVVTTQSGDCEPAALRQGSKRNILLFVCLSGMEHLEELGSVGRTGHNISNRLSKRIV